MEEGICTFRIDQECFESGAYGLSIVPEKCYCSQPLTSAQYVEQAAIIARVWTMLERVRRLAQRKG